MLFALKERKSKIMGMILRCLLWPLLLVLFAKSAEASDCQKISGYASCGGSGGTSTCPAPLKSVAHVLKQGNCYSSKQQICCSETITFDTCFTISYCDTTSSDAPLHLHIFGNDVKEVVDECPIGFKETIIKWCNAGVTRRCCRERPPTPSPTPAPKPVGCAGSYDDRTGQCTGNCYDVWSPYADCTVCRCKNGGSCIQLSDSSRKCSCPNTNSGWNGLLCDKCGTSVERWDDTTGTCNTCQPGFAGSRCKESTECVNGKPRVDFSYNCISSSCYQMWPNAQFLGMDVTSWTWSGANCDTVQPAPVKIRNYCNQRFDSTTDCGKNVDIRDWTIVAPLCAENFEQLGFVQRATDLINLATKCLFQKASVEYFESRYDFAVNTVGHEKGLKITFARISSSTILFQSILESGRHELCSSLCRCGSFGADCSETVDNVENSIELSRFLATRCRVSEDDTIFVPGTHLARALYCSRQLAMSSGNHQQVADRVLSEILMVAKKHLGSSFYDNNLIESPSLFLVDKVVRTAESIALFDIRGINQEKESISTTMPIFNVEMLQRGSVGGAVSGVKDQLDRISRMVSQLNEIDKQSFMMSSISSSTVSTATSLSDLFSSGFEGIQKAFELDLETALNRMDIQAQAMTEDLENIVDIMGTSLNNLEVIYQQAPGILDNIITAFSDGIEKSEQIADKYEELLKARRAKAIMQSIFFAVLSVGIVGVTAIAEGAKAIQDGAKKASGFKTHHYAVVLEGIGETQSNFVLLALKMADKFSFGDKLISPPTDDLIPTTGNLFYDTFVEMQASIINVTRRVQEVQENFKFTNDTTAEEDDVDIGDFLNRPKTAPISSGIWMKFYREIKHYFVFEVGYCEEPTVTTDFQPYLDVSRKRLLKQRGEKNLQKELKSMQEDLSEIIDHLNGNCSKMDDTLLSFAEFAEAYHEAAEEYVSKMLFVISHHRQKHLVKKQRDSTLEAFKQATITPEFDAASDENRRNSFTEMHKAILSLDVVNIEHVALDSITELCKAYRYAKPPGPPLSQSASSFINIDPQTCKFSLNRDPALQVGLTDRLEYIRNLLENYAIDWESKQLDDYTKTVSGTRTQRCFITKPKFFDDLFNGTKSGLKAQFDVNINSFRDFCYVNAEIEEFSIVFFDSEDNVLPEASETTQSTASFKLAPKSNFIKFSTTNNVLDDPHEFVPTRPYRYNVDYYAPSSNCQSEDEKMFFNNGKALVCNLFKHANKDETFFRPPPYTTWEIELFYPQNWINRMAKPVRAEVAFKLRVDDAYDPSLGNGQPCDSNFNMLGRNLNAQQALQNSEGTTCQWIFERSDSDLQAPVSVPAPAPQPLLPPSETSNISLAVITSAFAVAAVILGVVIFIRKSYHKKLRGEIFSSYSESNIYAGSASGPPPGSLHHSQGNPTFAIQEDDNNPTSKELEDKINRFFDIKDNKKHESIEV